MFRCEEPLSSPGVSKSISEGIIEEEEEDEEGGESNHKRKKEDDQEVVNVSILILSPFQGLFCNSNSQTINYSSKVMGH